MKEYFPKGRALRGIPFLLAATLFTLPLAATQSKYVWEKEIPITLTVEYPNTVITSVLLATPLVDCRLEGTGLQIQETQIPGQWLVLPEQGYDLPDCLLVKIGDAEYQLPANGGEQPAGLTFDPVQGLLTIALELLPTDGTAVTVIADGVPQQVTPAEQPVQQATPTPAPTTGQSQAADKEPATEAAEEAADADTVQQTPPVPETTPAPEESAADEVPAHEGEEPTETPRSEADTAVNDNAVMPSPTPAEEQNSALQTPTEGEGDADAIPTPAAPDGAVTEQAPSEQPLSTETALVVDKIPEAEPAPSEVTEVAEEPVEAGEEKLPTSAANSSAPVEAEVPETNVSGSEPAPEPVTPIPDNPAGTEPLPE